MKLNITIKKGEVNRSKIISIKKESIFYFIKSLKGYGWKVIALTKVE